MMRAGCALALLAVAAAASATAPTLGRGEQHLAVGFGECMRRAAAAFRLLGWTDVTADGRATVARKGELGGYVLCQGISGAQSIADIVVAAAEADAGSAGLERHQLQAQLNEPVPADDFVGDRQLPSAPLEPAGGTEPAPPMEPAAIPPPPGSPAPADAPVTAEPPAAAAPPAPPEPPLSPDGTNLALNRPASQSSLSDWSAQYPPGGGVDGIKRGAFGFQTDKEQSPWWQVDLGRSATLQEARVFNRITCCRERARTLRVLLSDDGTTWTTAYAHDGTPFGGADGSPLVVDLKGAIARYLRLQLTEDTWLHLDEVELIGE